MKSAQWKVICRIKSFYFAFPFVNPGFITYIPTIWGTARFRQRTRGLWKSWRVCAAATKSDQNLLVSDNIVGVSRRSMCENIKQAKVDFLSCKRKNVGWCAKYLGIRNLFILLAFKLYMVIKSFINILFVYLIFLLFLLFLLIRKKHEKCISITFPKRN